MEKGKLGKTHIDCLKEYQLNYDNPKMYELLKFKKGEYLCREGMPYKYLMVIYKGKVKTTYTVYNGKRLLLAFYDSKGILGDIELMTGTDMTTSSVQAVTDTVCIGIELKSYRSKLKNNLPFINYIGESLAGKLYQNSLNNPINLLVPLEARLCSYINAIQVDGMLTDNLSETAELLGTSYRHLMRTLSSLCSSGILARHKGIYKITDKNRLKEMAVECYMV